MRRKKYLHFLFLLIYHWNIYSLIFLELCGGTLNEFVKGNLPNIPRSAIPDKDIIGQIILGLCYLHGKNIVHKDLTPRNVLLKKQDDLILVKLTDFGLSKQLKGDQTSFSLTINPGTKPFTAPELYEIGVYNKRKPTFDSDIWSLGVVVSFVLSQGDPYGIGSDLRIHISTLKVPPNIHALNDWLAIHFVMQLMHHQPEKRPSVFHLLSHPYFSSDSRPMKYLVNTIFWDFFLSNEERVKTFLTGCKVNEWFEVLKNEVAEAGAFYNEFNRVNSYYFFYSSYSKYVSIVCFNRKIMGQQMSTKEQVLCLQSPRIFQRKSIWLSAFR
jgi:serine/threonine protein kinase